MIAAYVEQAEYQVVEYEIIFFSLSLGAHLLCQVFKSYEHTQMPGQHEATLFIYLFSKVAVISLIIIKWHAGIITSNKCLLDADKIDPLSSSTKDDNWYWNVDKINIYFFSL